MSNLTLGSLFDGSGGFPLAGALAGIIPVWASEIEPFPIRVTTKRLPSMKHYGDISTMDGGKIEPVDIITFGSPCQDMSIAGKREGLDGSRSNLFYQAIRIIKEMREATNGEYPRYIVWENVPGAFSSSKGDDFRCVLESICKIKDETITVSKPEKWQTSGQIVGDDFSVAWRVLDAQYWGVPQRRRRIFLVADFRSDRAGKILFEYESLSGYTPKGFDPWKRTTGSSEECFGKAGCHSLDGYNSSIGEVASTLGVNCGDSTGRNGVIEPLMFENHGQDSRYRGPLEVAQSVIATYGTGGNNQPFVVHEPKTMKIRCGKEGGGKGPLIQDNKSATLGCNNDQTLFVPTEENKELEPYGICAKDSNSMKSKNPKSGFYEADTSRTIDTSGSNPSCNQGGIAVVESYALQGSMIGRDDKNGPQGSGVNKDKSFTLNATDRHAVYSLKNGNFMRVEKDKTPTLAARDYKEANVVSYGIGRGAMNAGYESGHSIPIEKEKQPTMTASGPAGVAQPISFYPQMRAECVTPTENVSNTLINGTNPGFQNGVVDTHYTVRRLTPTECARLQGFPDWWCSGLETEEPTMDDIREWYNIFETHRKIIGTSSKPRSIKQIAKWLKDPHSDSAEYKMWGNGVALPCVYFVLSGIVYCTQKEED